MIGRLNHVAIATSDIKKAAKIYRDVLGGKVSEEVPQPDHGVTTVFVDLGNTKIELLEPLGENSPIANFLKKNPSGGMHHVCYEVDDIYAARDKMRAEGATITGTGEPRIGAHGKPVIFLHPEGFRRHAGRARTGVIHAVHASVLIGAYAIFWFLALFCLLPVGLGEVDPETGAPLHPKLLLKAAVATGVAALLWVGFYALILTGVLDL